MGQVLDRQLHSYIRKGRAMNLPKFSFSKVALGFFLIAIFPSFACTPAQSFEYVEPRKEYYQVATRQEPKEPVYSRVTWSQLPRPVPDAPVQKGKMIQPTMSFEMPNSTLAESLEALSQSIGYELRYPAKWAKRRVSLKFTGTVEEILAEICKQSRVKASLDHENKILRVHFSETSPRLPKDR